MPRPTKEKPEQSFRLLIESGSISSNLRYIAFFSVALFSLAALLFGEWLNFYATIWWWDDMLHGLSGVVLGLIGLLVVYYFNPPSKTLRPSFVAVFIFCFAMTIGVLWEIFEFSVDYFFGTAMQQWDMPANAIVIGRDFQGMGLRDIMSDLILASIGTLLSSTVSYLVYKRRRQIFLGHSSGKGSQGKPRKYKNS